METKITPEDGRVFSLKRREDVQYFHDRAEQEIERAQKADHPAAVRAHYLLADLYLDLVFSGPQSPPRPRNALQE